MGVFKLPLGFRKGGNKNTQSDEVEDPAPTPNETPEHGQRHSNSASLYSEGDFRNYPAGDVMQLRGVMMLEHLRAEQERRLWCTFGPSQGVVLKHSRGKYAACPPSLETEGGGLFNQVVMMNVRVCLVPFSLDLQQLILGLYSAQ
jgi:hypothetical protein